MRSRLSAAFLLLLSSIFLVGGVPARHLQAQILSVQQEVAPPGPSGQRQAIPRPAVPKAGQDFGAHHGFGGLAVPAGRLRHSNLARGAARPAVDDDAPAAERPSGLRARAPPHSTAL
ncbi:hypothetical protein OIE66_00580 [Nonomuraea sp. NBC_01738]|uniref:hypothetical protein n=1 Tax=Nonomuraea sp. NBC_01738 TaxID=2976003 RepID=UPI002E13E1CC|nr:hypothetical protein OIE66_00580 [Nonomuraea sp. NBC_01738]